jgi:hypothetical protein
MPSGKTVGFGRFVASSFLPRKRPFKSLFNRHYRQTEKLKPPLRRRDKRAKSLSEALGKGVSFHDLLAEEDRRKNQCRWPAVRADRIKEEPPMSQSPDPETTPILSGVRRAAGMILRFKIRMVVTLLLLLMVIVLAVVDLVENNVLACWAAFLLAYLLFHLPFVGKWLRSRIWLHNSIDRATLILAFLTVVSTAAGDEQERQDQKRAQDLETTTQIVIEHRELLAGILRLECGAPYREYRASVIDGLDREVSGEAWDAGGDLPSFAELADQVSARIDAKWRMCYYADEAQEAILQGWFYLDEAGRPGPTDDDGLPDLSETEDRRPIGVMPTFGKTFFFRPIQGPYIKAYPSLHARMISSMRTADLSHADDHKAGRLRSVMTAAQLEKTSADLLENRDGGSGPGMAPYLAFLLSISSGTAIALFRPKAKDASDTNGQKTG